LAESPRAVVAITTTKDVTVEEQQPP